MNKAIPGTCVAALALALAATAGPALADHHEEKKAPAKVDPAKEAERVKQLLGHFGRLDKNRNTALEGDELPKGWVDRYDRDGDDKVTKKEFATIIKRPPMLRRLHMLRDPRARAQNSLQRFDRDKNGTVSEEEYPGDRNVFRRGDRNKNGELEWKELLDSAEDELKDLRKRRKSPNRADFLNLFDVNYDRNVSAAEYDGPSRLFRKYDTNRDGTVTYEELYPRSMMNMEAAKPKPTDMNVLKAMDTDDDGKVSREEWKGTPSAWKRLDRNRDGWITIADAH